ncbi:hypothetical protein Tsubulata_047501 [Turnera subulata]|uniref:NB-ARC domain-containing protein n=1 Tax=Turnera subulata TaxID=218843 RepID=A0A9Q0FF98_9ROSI|nr:hypothetical protein Tsubulata_047501 [Turnera subulata]
MVFNPLILPECPLPSLTRLQSASKGFHYRHGVREFVFCDKLERSFRIWKLSTGLYRAESEGHESGLSILPEGIESTVRLQELRVYSCQEIRGFQFGRFKELRNLEVSKCPLFESLYCGDAEMPLLSLHYLSIRKCNNFISFPGQGLRAPNLMKLHLKNLTALEGLPKHMHSLLPSLTELALENCAKLRSFPEGGLPSSIQILVICGCRKLFADRKNWGLQALQSLSRLDIEDCDQVLESFPEETLLPPSLNSFQLCDFKHLKSLDYKGLEHLSSLSELKIFGCPELQSLQEEGLPSSLQYLAISGCPKTLMKRCQENGGDRHKISHIPWIVIG